MEPALRGIIEKVIDEELSEEKLSSNYGVFGAFKDRGLIDSVSSRDVRPRLHARLPGMARLQGEPRRGASPRGGGGARTHLREPRHRDKVEDKRDSEPLTETVNRVRRLFC